MADPWERQPEETPDAWAAFVQYRDMGSNRSTAKVAQALGKTKTIMDRWSSKHAWVRRCLAWDNEQDRQWREEQTAARKRMAERQAATAAAAQNKIAQFIVDLDPTRLTPTEAARWYEVAVKVERQARGEPDRVEVSGPGAGPIQIESMSPEDVMHRLAEIKAEIAATLGESDGVANG